MRGIKVLIDTNIILDVFLEREPFLQDAKRIFSLCENETIYGFVAAHSITDAFYILCHKMPKKTVRIVLLNVCRILDVVGIDDEKLIYSLLREDFSDFEDCLFDKCAMYADAYYIITRNTKDFASASVTAITPADFLSMMH